MVFFKNNTQYQSALTLIRCLKNVEKKMKKKYFRGFSTSVEYSCGKLKCSVAVWIKVWAKMQIKGGFESEWVPRGDLD